MRLKHLARNTLRIGALATSASIVALLLLVPSGHVFAAVENTAHLQTGNGFRRMGPDRRALSGFAALAQNGQGKDLLFQRGG